MPGKTSSSPAFLIEFGVDTALKKLTVFLLSLSCLFVLCGCARKTTEVFVTLEPTAQDAADALQPISIAVNFSAEESRAMSNFSNGGLYYFAGGSLYGRLLSPDSDFLRMGAADLGSTAARSLDGDISPAYMLISGEYLYYVRYPNSDSAVSIARMRPDGTELTKLYEGKDCDFLQLHGGRLYFTDENHRFVSADLDGGNIQTVIDRAVYYPYFIGEDLILFQDDSDGQSLHLFSASGGYDIKLNDMISYSPVICGSFLYYLGAEGIDENTRLCRIDLGSIKISAEDGVSKYELGRDVEAGESDVYSFHTNGQTIYGANGASAALAEWANFNDGGYSALAERICHIDDGFSIGFRLNEDNKVREVFIRNHSSGSTTVLPTLPAL